MSVREEYREMAVVVAAQDGAHAVLVTLYEGTYPIPNRIAVGCYFSFLQADRTSEGRVGVMFSDHFQFVEPKEFGLPDAMDRKQFQLQCSFAAMGEYLDTNGLLPATPDNAPATQIACFGPQFETWAKREAPSDDAILHYLREKTFWCWKFELELASFTEADCLRLHCSPRGMRRIAQIEDGNLWTIAGGSDGALMLKPLPTFIRDQRAQSQPGIIGTGQTIASLLSAPRYAGPAEHWKKSADFVRGDQRDLPNAAKEAICAVEGLTRIVTGAHSDTLGVLIKKLKTSHNVNAAMAKTLEGLWGFTSNSPGVRHGGATPATIDEKEARYVIDSCEAALRFLLTLDQ
jgi:hypothetical protein